MIPRRLKLLSRVPLPPLRPRISRCGGSVPLVMLRVPIPIVVMVEFGSHGSTAAVSADGEGHRHWVRDASQISMLAFHLALELITAEPGNLRLQIHAVDRPLELKVSLFILCEGPSRDGRDERARPTREFECHIFCQRINLIAASSEGETGLQIKGMKVFQRC